MADEADLAFDVEQRFVSQALLAQRRAKSVLQPVGRCHHCESTDLPAQRLFCDTDCAADWEYENALRRKLGLGGAAPLH